MKIRILFALLLLLPFKCYCAAINESQAAKIAQAIVAQDSRLKSNVYYDEALKLAYKGCVDGDIAYYVFNKVANNGYLIISGDDATAPLIGYSDNGAFEYAVIPDNMKWWLSNYAREIEFIRTKGKSKDKITVETQGSIIVNPLLKNIAWGQDSPFNNKCPQIDNSPTMVGCVALAMAQVMYYYKWPEKGIGEKSYLWNNQNISADFGNTTYQWDKMTDVYSPSNSTESKEAVSTLTYQCGISVGMNYGIDASASYSQNVPLALLDNFNYDNGIKILDREYYGRGAWETLLKKELDNGRPIIYSGQSEYDGHTFICDGYDSNNMFHINWGWNGTCNGYFKISLLTPDIYSDGLQAGGFNYYQDAIIGIQKPIEGSSRQPYMIGNGLETSNKTIKKGEPLSIIGNTLYNFGYGEFAGKYGVALYGQDDTTPLSTTWSEEVNIASYKSMVTNALSLVIPPDLSDGTYAIKGVVESKGIISSILIPITYHNLLLVVKGDECTLTSLEYANVKLSNLEMGDTYRNRLINIAFDASSSRNEYYGSFKVAVLDKDTHRQLFISDKIPADIIDGESINVEAQWQTDLEAGEYLVTILDIYGDELITPIQFALKEEPAASNLVVNSIDFEDANKVIANNFHATTNIANNGGYFNQQIRAYVYDLDNEIETYIPLSSFIEANSAKDISINASLGLLPGTYKLALTISDGDGFSPIAGNNWKEFTVIDGSGVEKIEKAIAIYPNPVESVINIKVDGEISNVKIIDIKGSVIIDDKEGSKSLSVHNLPSGVYALQVIINNELYTKMFIKK